MIGTFKVDQSATFQSAHLMSVEPKTEFKSTSQQLTSDGVPKWTAKVAVKYTVFGKTESEIININIASHNVPGQDIPEFSPVELGGFEVNIGEKRNRDGSAVPGVMQWYRCDELKAATSSNTSAKSTKTTGEAA